MEICDWSVKQTYRATRYNYTLSGRQDVLRKVQTYTEAEVKTMYKESNTNMKLIKPFRSFNWFHEPEDFILTSRIGLTYILNKTDTHYGFKNIASIVFILNEALDAKTTFADSKQLYSDLLFIIRKHKQNLRAEVLVKPELLKDLYQLIFYDMTKIRSAI